MNAGLEGIGDLVRNFPAQMSPHVSAILLYMIDCLNNPALIKTMRTSIFVAIGDLALGCPHEVKKEVEKLTQLYLLAFDAVIQILSTQVIHLTQTDETSLDFAHSMKSAVVESLTCLCHGLLYTEGVADAMVTKEMSLLILPFNSFLAVCLEEKNNPSEVEKNNM